jgi:hypothetical protein
MPGSGRAQRMEGFSSPTLDDDLRLNAVPPGEALWGCIRAGDEARAYAAAEQVPLGSAPAPEKADTRSVGAVPSYPGYEL